MENQGLLSQARGRALGGLSPGEVEAARPPRVCPACSGHRVSFGGDSLSGSVSREPNTSSRPGTGPCGKHSLASAP